MTKHCGLSRLLTFVVAGLFCLTLAAPQSRADEISVGTGILTLCWNGVFCPPDPGAATNVILPDPIDGFEHLSLHIAGNAAGPNLDSPVLLIFGSPLENLLFPFNTAGNDPFGPQDNPFVAVNGTILDAQLYQGYNGPPPDDDDPPTGVTWNLPGSPAYVGTEPNPLPVGGEKFVAQGDIFGIDDGGLFDNFLQVPEIAGGSDSTFVDWAQHIYDTPKSLALDGTLAALGIIAPGDAAAQAFIDNLLGRHNGANTPCVLQGQISIPKSDCVTGFRIWIYELNTSLFGSGDTLEVITDGFPLGTLITAYGRHCETVIRGQNEVEACSTLAPPDSKIAILMPFGVACEPDDPTCNPPEVPEPTSLLLLGTGLLGIGRQWRKRQQDRKKTEKQNVA